MSTLTPLLALERTLHRALNSVSPPPDLNEQYDRLREQTSKFHEDLSCMLGVDTHYLTFHDNVIRGLTERRRGSVREVGFSVQVCAYLKSDTSQHQHAPVQARLVIPAVASLRGLSNRVVYTTLLDLDTQTIGFVVHANDGRMRVVEAPYEQIEFVVGALTD